jgi:hypothetical protein
MALYSELPDAARQTVPLTSDIFLTQSRGDAKRRREEDANLFFFFPFSSLRLCAFA